MRLAPFAPIALALGLALAAEARADNVTFTGFAHGAETVNFSVSYPDPTKNASGYVWAGGFATVDGAASFVSYCVDLYQHIGFGELYPEYGAPGTGHVFANDRAYTDLGRLYSVAGVVDTSIKEAAFQIAVWEIAYETNAGPYSLGGPGNASFFGGTADSSGALLLASQWLAGLDSGAPRGVNVIESELHQDMITSSVPEPSTYMLMIAGLLAGAEISRRKRRRG
jgi:hypothetical protein